ncbi:MAG: hypothetical protein ACR2PR_03570 [Pseudohongiellaceae bacterium]
MAEDWGMDDEVFDDASPAAPVEQQAQTWGDDDEFVDVDQPDPPTPDEIPWYEHIPGAAETGLTFLTGAAGEITGGLRGLGTAIGSGLAPDAGPGAPGAVELGAREVADTRDAMTYEAGTDAGRAQIQGLGEMLAPVGEAYTAVEEGLGGAALDVTGSPAVATVAHTLPTAALEMLGLGVFKRASSAAKQAQELTDQVTDANMVADALQEVIEPEARSMEEIVKDISKKKAGRLGQDVMPDQEILSAAEDLGIVLNPSHYSTNEAYRAVEQAIKSQPNTQLAAREMEAIRQLAVKGDELIKDMDGNLDRNLLDETVKGRMMNTIDDLEKAAENAYSIVRDGTPVRREKVRAPDYEGGAYPMADRGEWYGEADYETRGGRLVGMTPDEFLDSAAPLEIDDVARDNIDDLKNHMESGRTIDPLTLYTGKRARDSDGRHRAIAAKELGMDTVPVVDFRKTEKVGGEGIPNATKIDPKTSQLYIDQRLAELGDDASLLTKAEVKLYKMLQRDKPPTFNALDTLRRDIGDGYKNKGAFKDEASGVLDQVYAVLIKDQQRAADAMGVGDEFKAARKLTQTRKNIEKRAMVMFGRQMEKSILPKLTQAATKMTKGDVSEFQNLMDALPADLRQKAAATMLNDIFTLGARNKSGGLGQGFANAYQSLERNASAKKVLMKYLPTEAARRFDALGKVSQGIYRAKALENTSRTARDILLALNEGGLAERVFRAGASGGARTMGWKLGGPYAGAAAADKLDSVIKKTMKKEEAADELLSSSAFESAMNKAMEGKVREAENMLKRSAAWRKWRNMLGEGTRRQIAIQGPIAWLTQQGEQEQPANVQ